MGKPSLVGLVAAAVLILPAKPQAQVSLGVRAAYAVPTGDALTVAGIGSFSEKDLYEAEMPLQLDVYWRFTRRLSAGVFYSYAFPRRGTQLESFCEGIPGASCSRLWNMRVGAQVEYGLMPGEWLEPWLAVGSALDISHFRVDSFSFTTPLGTASGDLDGTLRGWEWVNAQIGADVRLGQNLAFGPYFQFAIGQYTVQHIELAGATVAGGGIDEKKTHEWYTFGLRAKLDL